MKEIQKESTIPSLVSTTVWEAQTSQPGGGSDTSPRGEGDGAEEISTIDPASLPPTVSNDAILLPTITVTANIKMQLVGLEQVLALLHMTTEETVDDIVTHLGMPTGLQIHDMRFNIGTGNDPLLSVDMCAEAGHSTMPVGMTAHKRSSTADNDEALWEDILSITSEQISEAETVVRSAP